MTRDVGRLAFVRRTERLSGEILNICDFRLAVDRKNEGVDWIQNIHGIRPGQVRFDDLRAGGGELNLTPDQCLPPDS